MIECDAYPEHALLVFPGCKRLSRLRSLDRESAHDDKPVGITGRCFQGVIVVVARPGRRARQIQCFTQSIDQIATIGIRNSFRTTCKQNESRRPALGLGDVVETDTAARYGGRRMGCDYVGQKTIDPAGRYATVPNRV